MKPSKHVLRHKFLTSLEMSLYNQLKMESKKQNLPLTKMLDRAVEHYLESLKKES